MPGGNLLLWIRLDPSVEEMRSEDDKATFVVGWWEALLKYGHACCVHG
jgi:hypothetical protein